MMLWWLDNLFTWCSIGNSILVFNVLGWSLPQTFVFVDDKFWLASWTLFSLYCHSEAWKTSWTLHIQKVSIDRSMVLGYWWFQMDLLVLGPFFCDIASVSSSSLATPYLLSEMGWICPSFVWSSVFRLVHAWRELLPYCLGVVSSCLLLRETLCL